MVGGTAIHTIMAMVTVPTSTSITVPTPYITHRIAISGSGMTRGAGVSGQPCQFPIITTCMTAYGLAMPIRILTHIIPRRASSTLLVTCTVMAPGMVMVVDPIMSHRVGTVSVTALVIIDRNAMQGAMIGMNGRIVVAVMAIATDRNPGLQSGAPTGAPLPCQFPLLLPRLPACLV